MIPSQLADAVEARAKSAHRFVVGIAGPPGSGKTTLADQLLRVLKSRGAKASIVPMDGFHLDNAVLEMKSLLLRKGAPETFDAQSFVEHVKRIAAGEGDVSIPGFDRAADATVPGMHIVSSNDHIVLVEGNYLLLDVEPWSQLAGHFDMTIFLAPPTAVLEDRLIQRWLDHGLEPDAARERAMGNDIPNALTVMGHSVDADITLGNAS